MTPDRSTGRGLALEPLWTRPEPTDPADPPRTRGGDLPPALAARYGPRLAIPLREDRPTIVAHFVESLDGVVALGDGPGGGGELSGWFEPDRFVMGLLRSLSDAIVVGAGTVRHAPAHEWTPRRVNRAHAADYEAWRQALGLAPQPTTIVVTASGDIDPAHPALNAPDVPVVVLTTAPGARYLAGLSLPPHVRVGVRSDGGRVEPSAVVDAIYYAIQQDVDVINMSFAPASTFAAFSDPVMAQAISDAYQQGIVLVGASGDERFFGFTTGVAFSQNLHRPIGGSSFSGITPTYPLLDDPDPPDDQKDQEQKPDQSPQKHPRSHHAVAPGASIRHRDHLLPYTSV